MDLNDMDNQRWFHGVLRNRGAFLARGAVRRKRREEHSHNPSSDLALPFGEESSGFLAQLPRGVRVVAALVLHGMCREEIASALRLSPTAFRQRLTTLRKVLAEVPPTTREQWVVSARQRRLRQAAGLELGLIRQALLSYLKLSSGIGTHDPDGHLLIIEKKAPHNRQPPGNE